MTQDDPVRALIVGPLLCPECGWQLVRSHDNRSVSCENGVEPSCPLYRIRFKAPTINLERA